MATKRLMSDPLKKRRAQWAAQKRAARKQGKDGKATIELVVDEASLSALLLDWGLPAAAGGAELSRRLALQLQRLHAAIWPELSTRTPLFQAAVDYRSQRIEREYLNERCIGGNAAVERID